MQCPGGLSFEIVKEGVYSLLFFIIIIIIIIITNIFLTVCNDMFPFPNLNRNL